MTIRTRILGSLASLFIVSAIMLAGTWIVTSSQKDDAQVIKLSERQRMLAQKIARDAHAFAATHDSTYKTEVQNAVRVFDTTLTALSVGGKAPLSMERSSEMVEIPAPPAEAVAHLSRIATAWKAYKALAIQVLDDGAAPTGLSDACDALTNTMSKTGDLMQLLTESRVAWLLAMQGGCVLFGLLALGLAVYALQRNLLRPMEQLRTYADRVAAGALDATPQGDFSGELRILRDDIGSMVEAMRKRMAEADAATKDAARQAEETRKALEEAQAERTKTERLFETMTSVAGRAQGVSQQVFASVEELSRQIEVVNHGVDVQRDRMTETATAMEQMTGTVHEVAQNASSAAHSAAHSKENAQTGAEGVHRAVTSIENIQHRIMSLKETMGQLGQQADSISQIMTTISDIADQTNLLALNAAIEAARAGDAGRGFAVVADEVRKLAEKTMHATQEVGDAVKLIQAHARENVQAVELAAKDIVVSTEAANESGRFMQEIVQIVDETAMQVSSIATASEEQSAASEQINRAVSEVTRVASETAQGMAVSAHALMEISSLVEELDTVIQSLANGKATGVNTNGNGDLFTWTDDLSLNIKSIDDQHKRLVQLINDLHRAMKERRSKKHLVSIVDELKNYTVTHFKFEEKLFAKHGYPETKEHIAQHEKFVATVLDFENGLKADKVAVTMDVMRFLKDWLMKHINGTDRRYSGFLRERGVR